MVKASKKIWMDGALVNWDEATVHVLTHSLHYGLAPFEGIRCYQGNGGSAIFRLKEHVDRLFESAHIMMMPMPFSKPVVTEAIIETVRANQMESCYVRPIAFIGHGAMGVYPGDNPIRLAIAAWPWGSYLGEDALTQGIRAKISSFTRHHVNVSMTRAKVSGYYVNSILAKWEAKKSGYAECILLDPDGYVAEGTGENVFIVSKGIIKTTPLTSILDGITRNSILQLARAKKIPVIEERFTRDAMYVADEIFLTGTAAEVTPVRELDDRKIGEGKPGPITLSMQNDFFKIVRGEDPAYAHWLTAV